jgi:hypothetical protein
LGFVVSQAKRISRRAMQVGGDLIPAVTMIKD